MTAGFPWNTPAGCTLTRDSQAATLRSTAPITISPGTAPNCATWWPAGWMEPTSEEDHGGRSGTGPGPPGGDRRRRRDRRWLGAALPADGLRRRRLRPGPGGRGRPAPAAGHRLAGAGAAGPAA